MLKTTNIRTLKDRLSAFLRDVQRGDVILVTDRGRVVAEIRQPTVGVPAEDASAGKLQHLVAEGLLRLGLPNTKAAYRRPGVSLSARAVDRALEASRGEK